MKARLGNSLLWVVLPMIIAAFGASPAQADSAFVQFSLVNNPSGNWSYGYSTPTNPFTLITYHSDYIPGQDFGQGLGPNGPDLPRWIGRPSTGYVLANTLGTVQTSWFTIPPNVVILGPLDNLETLINSGAVLRWTAPATGTYTINGFFQGLNNLWYPSVNTVNITLNGNLLFGGPMDVNGPGSVLPFALTQYVQAGSYIDFTASGSQNTFPANLIGLSADVNLAPVPEPGTMLLLGTGLAGLFARRRKNL